MSKSVKKRNRLIAERKDQRNKISENGLSFQNSQQEIQLHHPCCHSWDVKYSHLHPPPIIWHTGALDFNVTCVVSHQPGIKKSYSQQSKLMKSHALFLCHVEETWLTCEFEFDTCGDCWHGWRALTCLSRHGVQWRARILVHGRTQTARRRLTPHLWALDIRNMKCWLRSANLHCSLEWDSCWGAAPSFSFFF